jgi:peptidoglycan/xylan/chitin deacetylase (PgdA/CDA1 family)
VAGPGLTPGARSTGLLALGAAAAAAGYWRHLSPYSQALGTFPYRAPHPVEPGAVGDRPVVALTFDDGPNEPYTSQIAAILAARGAVATFFQVGRCVQRHPGVTAGLAAAGHVVGNHSFSHSFTRGWTTSVVRRELADAQEALVDELGRRPLLYRPPWLIRTAGVLDALRAEGMHPVSGTFCHPLEPLQPPARRIAALALAQVRPGGIVIFHDGYDDRGGNRSATVEAVEIVVDTLLERGYGFVTVDRLLGVPAYA